MLCIIAAYAVMHRRVTVRLYDSVLDFICKAASNVGPYGLFWQPALVCYSSILYICLLIGQIKMFACFQYVNQRFIKHYGTTEQHLYETVSTVQLQFQQHMSLPVLKLFTPSINRLNSDGIITYSGQVIKIILF